MPQSETPLLKPNSGGLTGGVCKEQGHIHRLMLTSDYYGIQLHEGELALNPNYDWVSGLPSPFDVGTHCPNLCSARVAQEIRGIRTYR